MDKLNKPYLQELASKQRDLLVDTTKQLTEQLAALSTSKDSAEEKLKQLTSLVAKVSDPTKINKLQQFIDESANKKNPTKSEKIIKTDVVEEDNDAIFGSNRSIEDDNVSSRSSRTSFRPTTYKLPPNTPIFQSKGVGVEEWFFVMEQALELASIPKSKVLPIVSSYVTGTALQLLISYSDTYQADWNGFKEILREHFLPHDYQRRLRQQLISLKCTDSIDNYNRKFLSLITQITSITDTDKLFYYVEGLQAQARFQVLSKEPKTLTIAMAIATQFETCINRTKVEEVNVARRYNRTRFTKSGNVNSTGHGNGYNNNNSYNNKAAKTHNPKPNFTNVPKTNVKCFKCSKMGHYAKECRSSNYKRQGNNFSQKRGEQSKPAQLLTLSTIQPVETLLHADGTVDGIKVAFTLDSGSTISFISTRIAECNNIPIMESSIQIKSASNAITAVKGITPYTQININGHTCQLKLLVLDHDDHEVLLGLDWFNITGASLHPKERILRFPSDSIQLDHAQIADDDNEDIGQIAAIDLADSNDIEADIDWEMVDKFEITPIEELSKADAAEFNEFKQDIKDMFATSLSDLGCCTVSSHEIRLISTDPIFMHPYRKSIKERQQIQDEVNKLLEAGLIRTSRSPWASPVILVPKKDGSTRMCIDYRRLNAQTSTEQWPLPRINDILDGMTGSTWFTALDLKSGYHQIQMSSKSIPMTAFITPDGHYEFLRVPFGLKNAPAHFSKIMYQILGDLNQFVKIYLDDITIHSSSFKEHLQHLNIVIMRLRQANIKLNHSKCTWCSKRIKILGHIISAEGIAMDPAKISAIENMLPPKTVKQLQVFLGMANYYRKFIFNFAKIIKPLYELLKKDTPFNFEEQCMISFNTLKQKFIEGPILRSPDFSRRFIVFTDASGFAIGAILAQIDEKGDEYVCFYASRLLKGAELQYGITEKECLAVVWSVKQFRVYLYGAKFTIVTDHNALLWLMSIRDPTGRLARWSIYLQSYDYEIQHRKGLKHSNVDTLSRPVLTIEEVVDNEDETEIQRVDPLEDESLLHFIEFGRHLPGTSQKKIKKVLKLAPHFKYDNNTLWFKRNNDDHYVRVPARSERIALIKQEHLLGHFQTETVYNSMTTKYYWPKMKDDIQFQIKKCVVCNRHKKERVFNHPALAIDPVSIFDRIGIDLVLGLPVTEDGYLGLLVITEYLTKFPYVVPIRTKEATEIATRLFEYFSIFGPPRVMQSDQGPEFLNKVVKELTTMVGVEHVVTSAYNPQTNGLTERFNKTFCEALRKHAEADPITWTKWLPYILLAYRTRIHSVTKYSPFQLMFGRSMNTFGNWNDTSDEDSQMILNRTIQIKNLLQIHHPTALTNIHNHQEKQRDQQNLAKNILDKPLEIGTTVYVKIEGLIGKLEPRFRGPYTVVRMLQNGNYKLKNALGVELKTSYPLHKLKVTAQDEEPNNHYEIEKILDHRKHGPKFEYSVKWKDYDDSYNEWINEDKFDTLEIINKYWRNIHKPKNVNCLRVMGINLIHSLILLLLVFIVDTSVAQIRANEEILFCENKNPPTYLDWKSSCQHARQSSVNPIFKYKNRTKYTFTVLNKLRHTIHGIGSQCKKTRIITTYYKNFWGTEYMANEITDVVELTPTDCHNMVLTGLCHEQMMTCLNKDQCYYNPPRNPVFEYLRTIEVTSYSCSYFPRIIMADSLQSSLFGIPHCRASIGYCKFSDSMIVWGVDTISDPCPYEKLMSTTLELVDDDLWIDYANRLLFKVTSKVTSLCSKTNDMIPVTLYETAEGFYLTTSSYWNGLPVKNSTDLKSSHEFLLADRDFEDRRILRMFKDINRQTCFLYLGLIRSFSRLDDVYVQIEDLNGRNWVVYANHGSLYIPTCTNAKLTYVVSNMSRCYMDVPVLFEVRGLNFTGFLTAEKIIRSSSTLINCDNTTKRIIRLSDNFVIRVTGNKVEEVDPQTLLLQGIDITDTSPESNNEFAHYGGVFDAMDVIKSYDDAVHVSEMGQSFVAFADNRNTAQAYAEFETTWWGRSKIYIYWIIGIFIILISCCGTVWILTCADCCLAKCIFKPCRQFAKKRKQAKSKSIQSTTPLPTAPIELQVLMPPNQTTPSTSMISMQSHYAKQTQRQAIDRRSISSDQPRRHKHRDDVFRRGE